MSAPQDLKSYTRAQLTALVQEAGLARYTAEQLFTWIYRKRREDFSLMTNISKEARALFAARFSLWMPAVEASERAEDGTRKYLLRMPDGARIETVLIPEKERATVCVSSQVGCKFRCRFCVSGQGGWVRDLGVSEIVNQVLTVMDDSALRQITNIVFMGIGEPLDALEPVLAAIDILADEAGCALSRRKISISTCGLSDKIEELARRDAGVKLSVSLHAADDKKRAQIMPVARAYPLAGLMEALKSYSRQGEYPVTFEYILLAGFNTTVRDADKLAALVKGIPCKVNLIPCNASVPGCAAPVEGELERFIDELKRRRIFYTVRRSKGAAINAACGQLRAHAAER